ncbi:MAG TPA: hypothetical protein VE569_03405 [Acidimicrobiia bacterium]|jgi:hypothetical protein|nr:hypothetical protein [Acidimicrobiia bacterium]
MSRQTLALLAIASALGVAMATAALASGADAAPETSTFGTVPPEVMRDEMTVADLSRVPDYVAVWDQEGEHIAGYIKREELFAPLLHPTADQPDTPLAVVNRDKQSVGLWVHGVGFVPDEGKLAIRP